MIVSIQGHIPYVIWSKKDFVTIYYSRSLTDLIENTDRDSIDFYSLQLEGMLTFMEKLKGKRIDTADLLNAIDLCNRKRHGLKSLSSMFFNGNSSIDIADYYRIMELSSTAGINDFTDNIRSLNSHLKKDNGKEKRKIGAGF